MPVETTDKYVRVRVKNPDLFQTDSLRTIDMAKDGSIRAVIGRLKGETVTTVQSYLFDKDKFTEAEAVAWVEQHKKVHPLITMQREYKVFPILSKEVGEDRIVKSLFAVTGHVDSGNDRLWPGAFTQTLKERGDRIKVLWQHDAHEPPIGVPVLLKELRRDDLPAQMLELYPDATGGLLGHIKYLPTPRGDEVLTGIREGAITENSIGYDPISGKFDFDAKNVRNLHEVRLWDVSPVNWGMQELAINVKRALPLSEVDIALAVAWLGQKALLDTQLRGAVQAVRLAAGLKEGRVLSAHNLQKLKDALGVLNDLLLIAEPLGDEVVKLDVIARLDMAERELSLY